ncbi:hypothetical protein G3I19_31515 [Streptomyces sp. SID10853]|uniref:hypothetical protein n=1 Tax=Streptomyces sp. SID10853 TaxID=2706028 RepID=UPI0013C08726|nr:hypothetical protein [Streptomyces sp. SID10853]NDZ82975.1 hypothetical protein [Streptomyces sp. SID10853]
MSGLGWGVRLVGMGMLFSGAALLRALVREPSGEAGRLPLWSRLLILVAVVLGGALLLAVSFPLLVRSARHRSGTLGSFGGLPGERYVLYLRPFTIDPEMARPMPDAPGAMMRSPFEIPGMTQEDFLVRQFRRAGRVVAVGRPGERLPLLGAERGYLPLDDWQGTVSAMIRGAHAVIMSAAPGPGTVWEFTEALRILPPSRLVLLVYCDQPDYEAFGEAVAREYAMRSGAEGSGTWPPLPGLPPFPEPLPRSKRRWDLRLKGFVSFGDDWRASFTRFDPIVPRLRTVWTLRRLVRRELEPVLAPLSRLPAVVPPGSSGSPELE